MSKGFNPMTNEDVAAFFEGSYERFGELSALFDSIRKLAADPQNNAQIAQLCRLGRDCAADYENMCDCWREQVEKGGIRL